MSPLVSARPRRREFAGLDVFLHPAVWDDVETLRRARLTGRFVQVLGVLAVGYGMFYGLVIGYAAGARVLLAGAAAAAGLLAALRIWPRPRAVAHGITGVHFAVVAALMACEGGVRALATPLLSTPPIVAVFLLGRRGAVAWTAACVLTVAAFGAAEAHGVRFPVLYPAEWAARMAVGSPVGLVLATALPLLAFESMRAAAQARADAARAALTHQAYHDPLTGLANRAQFRAWIARALAAAYARSGDAGNVAVLLIDLDGFKQVNDALGHAAGDALLAAVADRLRDATRGSDLAARLGGDEFAVALDRVRTDADAAVVAERVGRALAAPFALGGASVTVGASIGIARGARPAGAAPGETPNGRPADAPGAEADGARVDALVRDADLALYAAKGHGRGRYVFYTPALHADADERAALEAALRAAVARGGLSLAYQPIVDLATGRVAGVEALARWHHPERGAVPPTVFIPLAEATGLIRPLGRWVLAEACRQGARWHAALAADGRAAAFTVAVNVSGRQLDDAGFVDDVTAVLAETGFPASSLVLELTESAVIDRPDVARARLGALRALGVRLAVDDFGTGYSALSYLRQFPVDVLKIDRSFVSPIAEGGQAAALTSAIVALGDALGLRTVAEGIETADQADRLRAMGCAAGQGYQFARPLDAEALTAWLAGSGAEAAAALSRP